MALTMDPRSTQFTPIFATQGPQKSSNLMTPANQSSIWFNDASNVWSHDAGILFSDPAQHGSNPFAAKSTVKRQGAAATLITGGTPYAKGKGEKKYSAGTETAYSGYKGVHIRHYAEEVFHAAHHGIHGSGDHGHGHTHTEKPATETPKKDVAPKQATSETTKSTPKKAVVTPEPVAKKTVAPPVRRRPISDDMRQMVEDLERRGAIPDENGKFAKVDDGPTVRKPQTNSTPVVEPQPKPKANTQTGKAVAKVETAAHNAHGHHSSTGVKVAEGALGVTGLAFGGLQAYGGFQQIGEGKVVKGSLNVVGGAGTAVAGGAQLAEVAGVGGKLATTVASKAGGVALIANGLHYGVKGGSQIAEGKYVEGGLNVTNGGAQVVGGVAMMAGAAPIAVGAAGVSAMADGIKTMYKGVDVSNGISNIKIKDPYKVAGGAIKTAGGGMMLAGAATLNAPLIIAGGVTYLGGMAVENGKAIKDGAVKAYKTVAKGVSKVANKVSQKIESAKKTAGAIYDKGADLAKSAVKTVSEKVESVKKTAGAIYDKGAEIAGSAVDTASSVVSSVADGAKAGWKKLTSWW